MTVKINLVSCKAEGLTLDACAKPRKKLDPISFVMSIRQTVRTENSGSCQNDFRENLCWEALLKSFDKIQVWLKSDEIIGSLYGNLNLFTTTLVTLVFMADIHSNC
jgi:hypothetical protein